MKGIPQEHANAHATLRRETEHIGYTQFVGIPESQGIIIQSFGAQVGK